MSVLVLHGERRVLGVRAEALAVLVDGELVVTRDPALVSEIHVYGDARLSTAARTLCLQRGVDVVFFHPGGSYLGRLSSAESPAGERRLAQLRTVLDEGRRLGVARAIVAGKVKNQVVHLQRVQRRVRSETLGDLLPAIAAAAGRAGDAAGLDELRGTEGFAARLYFEGLREAVANPGFRFEGRNRRPPRDPINAALSFGYTLLVSRVEAAVRGAGLDPYVGFLHEASRGNPATALDLAEEWRPLVDALVFGLVNRRELGPEDFQTPGVGLDRDAPEGPPAVHLGPVGREVLFRTWFRRLEDPIPVPTAEVRLTVRDAIGWQAAHLARVCEGRDAAYVPVRWA